MDAAERGLAMIVAVLCCGSNNAHAGSPHGILVSVRSTIRDLLCTRLAAAAAMPSTGTNIAPSIVACSAALREPSPVITKLTH